MAFSLLVPSSTLLSSSGKKNESRRRRKKKKSPIVVVVTTATTTQKKQVRFHIPTDAAATAIASVTTATDTTTGRHHPDRRGKQHASCGTKGRQSKRRTATTDHSRRLSSKTWYTAKELQSFRRFFLHNCLMGVRLSIPREQKG